MEERATSLIKDFILSLSTPHGSCLTNPIMLFIHPLSEYWASSRSPPITPFASWDLVKTHQTLLLLLAPAFCIQTERWREGTPQVWWAAEGWEKCANGKWMHHRWWRLSRQLWNSKFPFYSSEMILTPNMGIISFCKMFRSTTYWRWCAQIV